MSLWFRHLCALVKEPVVKQFAKGPRKKPQEGGPSYAGVVKGEYPPVRTAQTGQAADRLQNLERLVLRRRPALLTHCFWDF